ncbi:MAG: S-adenosylmethionine:tRNA ribosyltransferase-isomerase, partial [Hyphomicrobiaceae bacterium]|nr:S-adenosylmethionine:tRNA ribosyltransferase-isomerase [Hyphomicrobiaceae bacterium]
MRVDHFDFELPEDLIALRPATPRERARLLQVTPGTTTELSDHTVGDLPDLLRPGDALVFNDTRVIPAALEGRRERTGVTAGVALNLIKRVDSRTWRAFARPAKKLEPGDTISFHARATDEGKDAPQLTAFVTAKLDAGEIELRFPVDGPALDAAIAQIGAMPLPPYIALK